MTPGRAPGRADQIVAFAAEAGAATVAGLAGCAGLIDQAGSRFLGAFAPTQSGRGLRAEIRWTSAPVARQALQIEARRADAADAVAVRIFAADGAVWAQAMVFGVIAAAGREDAGGAGFLEQRLAQSERAQAELRARLAALESHVLAIDEAARDPSWRVEDEPHSPPPAEPGYVWRRVRVVEEAEPTWTAPYRP
ncbi:MAG: hypothetical protein ACOYJ6_16990 [Caulobacterales bacterium]